MQRRKRRVWSAVRKDAEAVRTGARRGALVARRGVKKGASDSIWTRWRGYESKILLARLSLAAATAHDNGPGGTPERLASWQCTTASLRLVAQSTGRDDGFGKPPAR